MIVLMSMEERKKYPVADYADISFGHGEKGHPKALCGTVSEVKVYDIGQVREMMEGYSAISSPNCHSLIKNDVVDGHHIIGVNLNPVVDKKED